MGELDLVAEGIASVEARAIGNGTGVVAGEARRHQRGASRLEIVDHKAEMRARVRQALTGLRGEDVDLDVTDSEPGDVDLRKGSRLRNLLETKHAGVEVDSAVVRRLSGRPRDTHMLESFKLHSSPARQ